MLGGLITPFTLMVKLTQGSNQTAGIAQLIRALAFQAGGCGFESHYPLKKTNLTEVRLARMKGTLALIGSQPLRRV
jgi:hypothetical protein